MEVAAGILTSRGGMTSHAAVVTRGMGKCCVAGAGDIDVDEKAARDARARARRCKDGDWISLDGTTGRVINGKLNTVARPARRSRAGQSSWAGPSPFRTHGRARQCRHPARRLQARAFGAEGIGLCRTEHMFFAEDRLPHMRAMILADNRKRPPRGAAEAAAHAARRLRRPVPGHGRLPGHHPHARSAAARVPAQARRPAWSRSRKLEDTKPQSPKLKELRTLLERVEELHESQPHARPARLPPRHHLSRDHRDAGARHLRGRRRGRERRRQGASPKS